MTVSIPARVALVGRGSHLDRLESELAEAEGRHARLVLLTGEAGAGKTRLASEFLRLHRDQVISLSARAYPLGVTASLGLWVEALERLLRTFGDEELLELCGGHVEDLAALLPSVFAAARIQPQGERPRIRLLGALAHLLQRLAERATVVVTLDDVHLADGSSWEALNYLSRNLTDARLLILLAARPEELTEHRIAGDVIRALEQEGLLDRLTVGPLLPADVRELAGEMLQGPVPDTLVDWLVDRARGSPLFATGLLRALIEEGGDLSQPLLRSLPEDLAERVQARTRDLDPGAKSILELLTVIGYRVDMHDLLRLAGRSPDEMGPMLERLERVRLVAEIEDGPELLYEISHPLIQEAIYGQIGGLRRRALHRHVARGLVEAGRYGSAASHIVRAADPGDEEAIETLCEALRQAEAGEHHREALALLEALLAMLPAGDPRWRRVVEVTPVTPEWVVDHRADSAADVGIRAMRRADQVLERSGSLAQRAAVKFRLGSLLAWGMCELEAGRALVEEARDLFAEAGDRRAVLLATNELGYQVGMADDGAAHERLARDVLVAAEDLGDQFIRLQGLCSLAWALTIAGRSDEALTAIEHGIEVASRSGRVYRQAYLHGMRAALRHRQGDRSARVELEVARDINPAYRDTLVLDFSAQIAWDEGDLDRAVAMALDQLAWDGGVSTRRAFGMSTAVMSLAEMGRHEEARALQTTLDDAFHGRRCWVLSRLASWSGAVLAGLSPDGTGSVPALVEVCEDATSNNYWHWARWMLADLAEGAASGHDPAVAARALELLESDPWPAAGALDGALRSFTTGAAATVLGVIGEGPESLNQAADAFGRAGRPLMEGRALALLGTSLVRVDRSRALEALERAVACFGRCGATVRQQRALAQLDALGPRGRRKRSPGTEAGALSGREREVARLASEGCSAREIGARLFIGERTVETHLANVYAKLGVASKMDLVRRAQELGI